MMKSLNSYSGRAFRVTGLALAIAVIVGCSREEAPEAKPSSSEAAIDKPVASVTVEATELSDPEVAKQAEAILPQVSLELPEGVTGQLWASEKLLADPVALSMDNQGRAWVAVTKRSNNSEFDIRPYPHWLTDSISFTSVEDRRAFLKRTFAADKNLTDKNVADRNKDGVHDWQDLAIEKEEVWLVTDTSGNGSANRAQLFMRDFNSEVTDVLGGIYYHNQRNELFLAVAPNAWRVKDTNGDLIADEKHAISDGFGVHIGFSGHGMSGVTLGPDGRIYYGIGDVGANITDNAGNNLPYPNQGVVVRSEPDGSNFEVFAAGVRNTHEFTFDKYGNLISVDNDGDHPGEHERLVYLIDGSDSGWRINWQFGKYTDPKNNDYKVWMDESYFQPRFEHQAAHILPPIAPYHSGPTGMTYNPGTALNDQWKEHFFVVEFVGSANRSGINAFTLEPDGASFSLASDKPFMRGVLSTGLDFGPDGALYMTDWIEGWGRNGKGRLWKLDTPETQDGNTRADTAALLAENFAARDAGQLVALLSHADMRVRSKAQFELAARGDQKAFTDVLGASDQLARIHAIWGLGQLARSEAAVAEPLVKLLSDSDAEIRAQVARVIGDAAYKPAAQALIDNLGHENARVRMLATQALGRLKAAEAVVPIVAMLAANDDKDVYLRHAGAVALARLDDADALAALTSHESEGVRLAAVVALGRMKSPAVANYLNDSSEFVVASAARVINDDLFIDEALPALAELLGKTPFKGEPLLRRVINANAFGASADDAARLAAFAADKTAPEVLRAEAIDALSTWAEPSVFDRVSGRYRGERHNNGDDAKSALASVYQGLLQDKSPVVRESAVKALGSLAYADAAERLNTHLTGDDTAAVRLAALGSLQTLGYSKMGEAVFKAMNDPATDVRMAALTMLPELGLPVPQTVEMHTILLDKATVPEQQAALKSLATIKAPEAEAVLADQMQRLIDGKIAPEVQLDLITAVKDAGNAELTALLGTYEASKDRSQPLDIYREALKGGDAMRGQNLFRYSSSAQCIRCHMVGKRGTTVGPDLTSIGLTLTREQLLEAMVAPGVRVAPGFGRTTVTLANGSEVEGAFESETESHITVLSNDGVAHEIARSDIVTQTYSPSGMPPMGMILPVEQVRDLVEYLTTLQGQEEQESH